MVWHIIWTFCGVYPVTYALLFAPNIYMIICAAIISLAWDYVNHLQYVSKE